MKTKTDFNFKVLLTQAKKDKKKFRELKNLAVSCGAMELACELRDMERKLFPETKEQVEAKKRGKDLNTIFRMVELDIPHGKHCWVLEQAVKGFAKKKGKFSIYDAVQIVCKSQELFD